MDTTPESARGDIIEKMNMQNRVHLQIFCISPAQTIIMREIKREGEKIQMKQTQFVDDEIFSSLEVLELISSIRIVVHQNDFFMGIANPRCISAILEVTRCFV